MTNQETVDELRLTRAVLLNTWVASAATQAALADSRHAIRQSSRLLYLTRDAAKFWVKLPG